MKYDIHKLKSLGQANTISPEKILVCGWTKREQSRGVTTEWTMALSAVREQLQGSLVLWLQHRHVMLLLLLIH